MASLDQCRKALAACEQRATWLRAEIARQEALPAVCACGAEAAPKYRGRCRPCWHRQQNAKRRPPCTSGQRHAWKPDGVTCWKCGFVQPRKTPKAKGCIDSRRPDAACKQPSDAVAYVAKAVECRQPEQP